MIVLSLFTSLAKVYNIFPSQSQNLSDELDLVLQLSWLERHTDNVEVGSSTLPGTTEEKKKQKVKKKSAW